MDETTQARALRIRHWGAQRSVNAGTDAPTRQRRDHRTEAAVAAPAGGPRPARRRRHPSADTRRDRSSQNRYRARWAPGRRGCRAGRRCARTPGPRQHVGQAVDHEGRARLEDVEHRQHGRAHRPGERAVWDKLAAVADGGQLPQVARSSSSGATPRPGPRAPAPTGGCRALLEAHEVVDADPGERGQLGPAQAGRAAARSPGVRPRPVTPTPVGCAGTGPGRRRSRHQVCQPPRRFGWPCGGQHRCGLPPVAGQPHRCRHDEHDHPTPRPFPPLVAGPWPRRRPLLVSASRSATSAWPRSRPVRRLRRPLAVGETIDDTSITATVALASIDTANADPRRPRPLRRPARRREPADDDVRVDRRSPATDRTGPRRRPHDRRRHRADRVRRRVRRRRRLLRRHPPRRLRGDR